MRRPTDHLWCYPAALLTGAWRTGASKSSLIHAGPFSALARGSLTTGSQDWPRIVLTPTDRPLDEMCAHLAQVSGSDITAVREALRSKPGQIRLYARQAVRDCLEVGCGV